MCAQDFPLYSIFMYQVMNSAYYIVVVIEYGFMFDE